MIFKQNMKDIDSPIHNKIREAGLSDATDCSPYSCVEFLRRYNRWRRGGETLAMEDPKAIGNALDAICDLVETLQRERNAMASRIHRASVAFCKDGSDGEIAAEMFRILSENATRMPYHPQKDDENTN